MSQRDSQTISILTFHSISNGGGPTNIPVDTFKMQVETIAELGIDVIGLDDVDQWLNGNREITHPSIVITFDDAFEDFSETAFPVLDRFGYRACVFAPTNLVGGFEDWAPENASKRKLMDWMTVKALSERGVDFGSHSRSHCKLTALSEEDLEAELSGSREELESRLSRKTCYFAPPYGDSDKRVLAAISRHYDLSVGVRLNEARQSSPRFDLPRIEMHYYRNESNWRMFLKRKGRVYFNLRRVLREAKSAVESIMPS